MFTRAIKFCFPRDSIKVLNWLVIAIASLAMLACQFDSRVLADEPELATVVCFGDSITNRGYYNTLGDLLSVKTINAGVGGNSSEKGLRRIKQDVLDHQPDVVVILFGTNDMRADAPKVYVPVDQYRKNLKAMVDACAQIDARVVMCTLPPIDKTAYFQRHQEEDFENVGGFEKVLQDYRAAAQAVAAKHGLPIVDLNKILSKEPKWMSKDGVHPSPEGNSILAKHIAKAVAPLLTKTADEHIQPDDKIHSADIVIYGATSAGVVAAVQAARMNKSVLLLEQKTHVGGLTTGGLGATDIGNKAVVGGLSREFYHRVAKHYASESAWTQETREEFFENRSKRSTIKDVTGPEGTMWTFEPHVAQNIFKKMLAEAGVSVRTEQPLAEVKKDGARIVEITSVDGNVYRAKMFIDCTYEGDLIGQSRRDLQRGS